MTPNPRQQALLAEVAAHGSRSIEELARALDVTPQTVRRDVGQLAQAGVLARFHGGVRTPESTIENIAYAKRKSLNAPGKQRIAQAVAARIKPGTSLFMNIGTTTEAAARAMVRHDDLRVVTNNLNVAAILADNPRCDLLVTGGAVRHRDRAIIGEATVDFIRRFKVDVGLIGISSIERDGTLRDFDYHEVSAARAIIDQSREVWLLADHTKFSRHAMVELAHLSQVDVLFTDAPPPDELLAMLQDSGGRCVVAD